MTSLFPKLPDWCRPGAPVVVTSQAGEASTVDPEGRGLWKAAKVESVTGNDVVVRFTPPYGGTAGVMTFRADGPEHRPYRASTLTRKRTGYLAPADADDVVAQRFNRDRAKYGPGRREWFLTPDGWASGPLRTVPEEEG